MDDEELTPQEDERTASVARMDAAALEGKLATLPKAPGVYLFKDKNETVIYVGKAKSLRSRVHSYFQESGSDARYFIPILRRIVRDLETVVTQSEKEAAVLENELIKQHQPRFNVKLRDDKDFLCLRLDTTKAWPRLETVRRPSPDHARYFGPYHSATSARRTLHLVNKHFQLRTCSDADLASRRRPCLQFQIKRCPAPCVMDVDAAWYGEQVHNVALFLEGRHDELTGELTTRMRDASRDMEFERAAVYRDQLRAVEAVREEQRVVSVKDVDQDIVGLYREGSVVEIVVLLVRAGRVSDSLSFSLKAMELPDEEVLAGFLAQYYGEGGQAGALLPDEILLPVLPDGADGVAEWLTERKKRKVALAVPRRGPRAHLAKMAADNAAHAFKEKQRGSDDIEDRLEELREKLRLDVLPRRIECCDISHLGGGDTVGSIVSLVDGRPDKKRYRSFHVRRETEGDDYGAMYEVLARRFRRGKAARTSVENLPAAAQVLEAREPLSSNPSSTRTPNGAPIQDDPIGAGAPIGESGSETSAPIQDDPIGAGAPIGERGSETSAPIQDDPIGAGAPIGERGSETSAPIQDDPIGAGPPIGESGSETDSWSLPDLLVVDGGRGQLQVALSAARDLGLHDLAIVGLAKERETVRGDKEVDRVYLPGQKNGIPLRSTSSALFFLARARDEAHRFANHARKKLGAKRRMKSELDDVAGLGPKTRASLLRVLGSVEGIRAASDEAILAVPGITARHLRALRVAFALPEALPS